ncbi:hypothetical protein COLO4_30655 [Corchorus olitorius]|uniref:Beta-galactosidase n=1 Tax=Corchorus olitorius TaxID=93759 RepID=A0A1R3H7N6_9ROSI|nr:hypothetical protein COLO4_30655 [Corchorus olitorius]
MAMDSNSKLSVMWKALLVVLLASWVFSVTASVSYDRKAITINGQRRILISGSIHYPRSTPEYYFEGNYDLVKFIKLVKQAGLYVHLRIGPYVCAEWNFGGFPVWLKYIPGINFRTNNGPFKAQMQKFTKKIVDMMKAERLFETQGGPIILSQIENEYGPMEYELGSPGLLRQPKWGHLKDLHRAIKLCEPALVNGDPTVVRLGNYQEAHVFNYKAGGCAAFLANYNPRSYAKVSFRDMHYNLPPWSISILPDCKNTVYNTARAYNEETASDVDSSFTMVGLLEQINTTRDASDYLWYTTDVKIDPREGFLRNGKSPVLTVLSAGHALHVFVNGQLSGSSYGSLEFPKLTYSKGVNLRAGVNSISLLSIAVGLPNVGPHFETWNAGILGPVTLNGLNEGRRDLSWQKWSYKIGLKGEAMNLHSLSGSSSVEWAQGSFVTRKQPLTWYKTTFNAPAGNSPLALDMGSMGKGQIWINGQSIGRHWPAYKASGSCGYCDYAGTFNEKKCLTNCGEASQRWYHVPRSWLKPTGNLLVVFEEWGGNPNAISLVRRETDSVCADIYEWQPNLMNYQMQASGRVNKPLRPKVHLECDAGQKISAVKFASFGTPQGVCGSYREGSCHAHHSYDAFNRLCVGQNFCSVTVAPEMFGGDPCPSVMKKLSVEVVCS